jgi:hypothetical protein
MPNQPVGSTPNQGRASAPDIPEIIVEQWLSHVESDPGRILSQQFSLEESEAWNQSQGQLRETRPW